jgi:Lon protease-like protein
MDEAPDPDWIPIFPLENVVLFPKVRLPLHIFELRYRQMTREALAGDSRIGMVTAVPERVQDTGGTPAVFKIGCEGIISDQERLPDGRYNIVLLGLYRFRILEEQIPNHERAYRVARIERLAEIPASGDAEEDEIAQQRSEIVQRMAEWLRRTNGNPEESISEELLRPFDDETFVNMLAQSIDFAPAEKQALLECDAVLQRIRELKGLLQFRLSELSSRSAGQTPVH